MAGSAADRLATLASEFWESFVATHPTFATALGDRRFDDRLEDWSPAGIRRRKETLATFARHLEVLPQPELGPGDRVTLAELDAAVRGELAELEAGLHEWTVNPLDGPQVDYLNIESFQPVATAEEGDAMAARWRAMGPAIDIHVDNLRMALDQGRVAVADPVLRTLDEIHDLLAQPDGEWPLLRPLSSGRAEWPAGERARFEGELRAAVRDVVRPAFERLEGVLRTDVLPASRPSERPGVMHLDGGEEAYRRLIIRHTSLDLAPEELHETGLAEIERIDREFVELGRAILGTNGLAETLSRLRTDPGLYFATGDEVFETAEGALARAQAAVPDWFGIRPQAGCEVVHMGEHEAKHSTIAYYRNPAADGSRPGRYYINTAEPETRPRYEAEALAYHEAVPGHHLQIAIAQELDGLPAFRRHLGSTAFVEGWALYTERLADEIGLYSGDLDRIGIRSFDAWRASRLVVDTGMHALGWSRQQAIDFMVTHTALAPNNVANEVDRYIVWPAQALAYKIGQLEILQLRHEAETRLGPSFDIRAFHDVILRDGAVGLVTLRQLVRDWVENPR
jgi:uncharacterized protein (DUF885 family)